MALMYQDATVTSDGGGAPRVGETITVTWIVTGDIYAVKRPSVRRAADTWYNTPGYEFDSAARPPRVHFVPHKVGAYRVSLYLNNTMYSTTVNVLPHVVDASRCRLTFDHDPVVAGSTTTVTLDLLDRCGNAVTPAGEAVGDVVTVAPLNAFLTVLAPDAQTAWAVHPVSGALQKTITPPLGTGDAIVEVSAVLNGEAVPARHLRVIPHGLSAAATRPRIPMVQGAENCHFLCASAVLFSFLLGKFPAAGLQFEEPTFKDLVRQDPVDGSGSIVSANGRGLPQYTLQALIERLDLERYLEVEHFGTQESVNAALQNGRGPLLGSLPGAAVKGRRMLDTVAGPNAAPSHTVVLLGIRACAGVQCYQVSNYISVKSSILHFPCTYRPLTKYVFGIREKSPLPAASITLARNQTATQLKARLGAAWHQRSGRAGETGQDDDEDDDEENIPCGSAPESLPRLRC